MPHKALASPKCRVYVYGNRVLSLENGGCLRLHLKENGIDANIFH